MEVGLSEKVWFEVAVEGKGESCQCFLGGGGGVRENFLVKSKDRIHQEERAGSVPGLEVFGAVGTDLRDRR